jgi:hypothetical protein
MTLGSAYRAEHRPAIRTRVFRQSGVLVHVQQTLSATSSALAALSQMQHGGEICISGDATRQRRIHRIVFSEQEIMILCGGVAT